MRRLATRVILGTVLLFGLASETSAQAVDVGVGVQRQEGYNALLLKAGVDQGVKTSGNMLISVVGEFGIQFFDGFSQKALLGGVRFGRTQGDGAKPFGQVLAGGFFCCDTTAFGLQFGGGADIPIDNFTLRLQADIPVAFYDGNTENGFRISVGAVFPFR